MKNVQQTKDERISYLGHYDDVNLMLAKSDVFFSFSRYETFQYAIAEAIYAGVPVIKNNCDGTNWANSIPIVKVVNNSLEFKQAIMSIKNITEEDIVLSRNIIESSYSNEAWVKKIINVYKKLTG